MAPCDWKYTLHLYPQSVLLCERKPRFDMRGNPFAEMILNESVLTLGSRRKGQYGTLLLCA